MTSPSPRVIWWRCAGLALAIGCAIEPNPSPSTDPSKNGLDGDDQLATDGADGVPGTGGTEGTGATDGGDGAEPAVPDGEAADATGSDGATDDAAIGDTDEPPTGHCPVVDAAPCGGALEGTWAIAEFCPDDPEAAAALCQLPFADVACADTEARCPFARSGTLTFEGATATMDSTTSIAPTYRFSAACVEARQPAAADLAAGCAAIANEKLVCVVDEGACVCTGGTEPEVAHDVLPFTATGSNLTLGESQASYCVSGDRLTIDFAEHPVSWRWWVLTRP